MLSRVRNRAWIDLGLADALVAFIVVTSAVMLVQLICGQFRPQFALLFSLLICGAGALLLVRRIVMPANPRILRAVALAAFLALLLRWSPFLHVVGGQDQGLYVAMSSYFERTHGLRITDEVRQRLRPDEREEYDRLNNQHDGANAAVPGRSEGEHQPGIFIEDLNRSAYSFQFYPLHPLWMAMAGKLLGEGNRVYSLVFFSVLSILMVSLLAYELAGRRLLAAFMTAGLLALNPMHVFLSRFPVTENLVLFFSASALYQLLRYFKSAGSGVQEPWRLVLSVGSWACLFFTHIGGFLYLPLVFTAVIAGIAAANAPKGMGQLLGYGIGVLFAYLLSVAYGLTWSFPYSHGIYHAFLGSEPGRIFVSHWEWIGILLAFSLCGLGYLTWRFRAQVRSNWSRWHVGRVLAIALLGVILAAAGRGLAEGYRLGFTNAYAAAASTETGTVGAAKKAHSFAAAGANRVRIVSRFGNTGLAGFTHTSIVALALYISPFVLLFVIAMLAIQWRGIGIYELFLVLLVTQFVVLRTGVVTLTPYYYYGRYLGAELVPFFLLLAALWLHRLWDAPGRFARLAARAIFGLGLAWEAAALAPQYPGGQMHRVDAGMRPLAQRITPEDIVLWVHGGLPELRTALDYYYGKHSVVVDPARLREAIAQYSRDWKRVYVVSNVGSLPGLSLIEEIVLIRDSYTTGRILDVLPMKSSARELRYFLFEHRPELIRLRPGDEIRFDRRGNAGAYLGGGWSGQEDSMRWTDGPTADLLLPFSDSSATLTLDFDVHSYGCADVNVRVNGEQRKRWTFSPCGGYSSQTVLLTPTDLGAGTVVLSFDMPGATSPHERNPALSDRRKLGISVRKVVIAKKLASASATPGIEAMQQPPTRGETGTGGTTSALHQALAAGIDFSQPELPKMIERTRGLSVAESSGRWTDGPITQIRFAGPLPMKFSLEIVVAHVYGPNRGHPVKVGIGDVEREFTTTRNDESVRLEFVLRTPADTIEFRIPHPTSPVSRGESSDPRHLGVRLKAIRVVPQK